MYDMADPISGWFGISFPDEPCEMVPAKAVIAKGDAAAAYALVSVAEILEEPEAIPGLTDLVVARGGGGGGDGAETSGGSSMSFTAPVASLAPALDVDDEVEDEGGGGGGGGGGLNVVYARGSSPTLGYHGPNKACFMIE